MTSFQIGITPRAKRVARFIALVQSEIRRAFAEEKERNNLSQYELATRCQMDKGSLSRRINGESNLTLATIAELAYGLNREIKFELVERKPGLARHNHLVEKQATPETAPGFIVHLRNEPPPAPSSETGATQTVGRELVHG